MEFGHKYYMSAAGNAAVGTYYPDPQEKDVAANTKGASTESTSSPFDEGLDQAGTALNGLRKDAPIAVIHTIQFSLPTATVFNFVISDHSATQAYWSGEHHVESAGGGEDPFTWNGELWIPNPAEFQSGWGGGVGFCVVTSGSAAAWNVIYSIMPPRIKCDLTRTRATPTAQYPRGLTTGWAIRVPS